MQIKLRFVHRDISRHGKVRYYFRRAVGQQKHRLPGEPGEPEFHRAYHQLFADTEPDAAMPTPEQEPFPAETDAPVGYMSVEQCRASLPIAISRREVTGYIRAAGPDFYQEHRRQLFLSPQQWAAVVNTIKPRGTRKGPRATRSSALPPEAAFRKAQAMLRKRSS